MPGSISPPRKARRSAPRGAGPSKRRGWITITACLCSCGIPKGMRPCTGTPRACASRQVLVAKGGVVEGDVVTHEAIIGGEVRGGIGAQERVELQATSVVHGDITTKRLFVQEGGEINGVIRMGEAVERVPAESRH